MTWTPAMEKELRYLIRLDYARQQRKAASCEGKPAFSSPEHARAGKPRRSMHGHVTVYRCQFCRLWHVGGHLSPKNRDRRPKSASGERIEL